MLQADSMTQRAVEYVMSRREDLLRNALRDHGVDVSNPDDLKGRLHSIQYGYDGPETVYCDGQIIVTLPSKQEVFRAAINYSAMV